jgi:glutaredoxin 3
MGTAGTIAVMAPVEIYTTPYCPYCQWAKELLGKKSVAFTEFNIAGNRELRSKMIARANGRTTVPQIFIGSTHVGGCDDLYALEDDGKLDALLKEAVTAGGTT